MNNLTAVLTVTCDSSLVADIWHVKLHVVVVGIYTAVEIFNVHTEN